MSRPEPATRTQRSYAPPATQRTNKMAIWSLILSIVWLGGLGSLAGIFLGITPGRRPGGRLGRDARSEVPLRSGEVEISGI